MFEHDLSIKAFDPNDLSEILRFAEGHPIFPFHSAREIERFATRLVSSTRNVFDVHRGDERVTVAVLVDNIDNPSNAANLEILGLRKDAGVSVIEYVLAEAMKALPDGKRALHFSHHRSYPIAEELLLSRGFLKVYETYDMEMAGEPMRDAELPKDLAFETLRVEDFDEFYRVMCKAFEKNLETSIPPLDEMRAGYAKRAIPNVVVRVDGAIVGHVNVRLSAPHEGEISQVGVLPGHRKRNLGASLLSEGIRILRAQGANVIKLTVAVENDRALSLYESFGFQVKEKSAVFERKR